MNTFFKTLNFLGLSSPWARLVFGTSLGFAAQMIIKPSISYDKNFQAKSFYLTSSKGDKNSTFFPWWVWPLSGGIIFSVFI